MKYLPVISNPRIRISRQKKTSLLSFCKCYEKQINAGAAPEPWAPEPDLGFQTCCCVLDSLVFSDWLSGVSHGCKCRNIPLFVHVLLKEPVSKSTCSETYYYIIFISTHIPIPQCKSFPNNGRFGTFVMRKYRVCLEQFFACTPEFVISLWLNPNEWRIAAAMLWFLQSHPSHFLGVSEIHYYTTVKSREFCAARGVPYSVWSSLRPYSNKISPSYGLWRNPRNIWKTLMWFGHIPKREPPWYATMFISR